jgi:hypothetical protein
MSCCREPPSPSARNGGDLFAAARSDHVEQIIRPAVQRGEVVLCDRFIDLSRVYQGVTGGLAPALMAEIERVAINGMMPDLTLILDLDPAEGLKRATARRGQGEGPTASRKKRSISTSAGALLSWPSPSRNHTVAWWLTHHNRPTLWKMPSPKPCLPH